jgi:RNA polymerase subunit RPABC4/transcription elongation factor Spt4
MTLKACAECGQPVSPHAPQCPRCGRRHPTVRQAGPDLPLLSATSPGMPAIRCVECGTPIRGRVAVCPVCGGRNTVEKPFPWRQVMLAAAVVAAIPVAWQLYNRLSNRLARNAGFVHLGPPPPSRVPQVLAYGFPAQCTDPAPVYIFEAGSVPGSFIVKLGPRGPEPQKVTKSLVAKYQLTTPGYDPDKQGFAVSLSPPLVAKLRCDLFVESIQEDPADRFNRQSQH